MAFSRALHPEPGGAALSWAGFKQPHDALDPKQHEEEEGEEKRERVNRPPE